MMQIDVRTEFTGYDPDSGWPLVEYIYPDRTEIVPVDPVLFDVLFPMEA